MQGCLEGSGENREQLNNGRRWQLGLLDELTRRLPQLMRPWNHGFVGFEDRSQTREFDLALVRRVRGWW